MKIKIRRQISQRIVNRVKKMCKVGLGLLVAQYLLNTAVVQVVKDQLLGNIDSDNIVNDEAFIDRFGHL